MKDPQNLRAETPPAAQPQVTVSHLDRKGMVAGVVTMLPLALSIVPFGMVFGILSREAGLDSLETMALTSLVIAGASQFAALPLLEQHAPVFVIVATGAVINLRMAMYSAALAAHWPPTVPWIRFTAAYILFDQNFSLTMRRRDERPDEPADVSIGFFFGAGLFCATIWISSSVVGALVGAQIPEGWALDFAMPVTFLAIVAPMIRGAANITAAAVGTVLSLLLMGLPYNLGFLLAGLAGVTAGYCVDRLVHGQGEDARHDF